MAKEEHKPVPVQGSLGLLAYGAQGLRAWRHALKQAREKIKKPGLQND